MKLRWLKSLGGNSIPTRPAGQTGCGKTRFWCHSERSEESLFDLSSMHREILRFAQNDKRTFSAASQSRIHSAYFTARPNRLGKKPGSTAILGCVPFLSAGKTAQPRMAVLQMP